MKLTNAQHTLIKDVTWKINLAKSSTAMDFFKTLHPSGNDNMFLGYGMEEYTDALNNIVHYRAKHETLEKLEKVGLIKIIDKEGNKFQLL